MWTRRRSGPSSELPEFQIPEFHKVKNRDSPVRDFLSQASADPSRALSALGRSGPSEKPYNHYDNVAKIHATGTYTIAEKVENSGTNQLNVVKFQPLQHSKLKLLVIFFIKRP